MPANSQRETATIFQFPVGGRAGLSAKRASNDRLVEMPAVAFGGGWYHDEAIQEAADAARKN